MLFRWGRISAAMSNAARRVLTRAVLATVAALLLTLALLYLERQLIGVALTELDLIEGTLLPIAVGLPITIVIFAQAERLRRAYSELAALHGETAKARDRLKQATETIRHAATHDGMTGLLNRTHFFEQLDYVYGLGEEAVLLIADVDHFKQINDKFGHLKGDEALVGIADVLNHGVRRGDVVGRVGGEEFGLILRHTTVAQAADLAEMLRRRVEQIPWTDGGLSISIGGASFADSSSGAMDVFEQADRQLYRAKRAGRNCIALHSALSEVASAMARQDWHGPETGDRDDDDDLLVDRSASALGR